jgi:putative FmdB family regulatory protein
LNESRDEESRPMPIYEYACEKCAHEFEREQRITEDPVKTCPKCKAKKVRRLISRTAFVLKGGGWYSDLYSSSKPASESGSKGDGDSPSPSAGAGESKPESKSESNSESTSKSKPDSGPKPSGTGKGKSKGKSAKAA